MKNIKILLVSSLCLISFSQALARDFKEAENVIIYGLKDIEMELAKETPDLAWLKWRTNDVENAITIYGEDGFQLRAGNHVAKYKYLREEVQHELTRLRLFDYSNSATKAKGCRAFDEITRLTPAEYLQKQVVIMNKAKEIFNSHNSPIPVDEVAVVSQYGINTSKMITKANELGCALLQAPGEFDVIIAESEECGEKIVSAVNADASSPMEQIQTINMQTSCSKGGLATIEPFKGRVELQQEVIGTEEEARMEKAVNDFQTYLKSL